MAGYFSDLAEHTGTLVSILGFFALICLGLVGAIYKIALSFKTDIVARIQILDDRLMGQEGAIKACATWEELEPKLDAITSRQLDLRQNILPRDYMRKDDMQPWTMLIKQGFEDIGKRVDAVSHRLDGLLGLKREK